MNETKLEDLEPTRYMLKRGASSPLNITLEREWSILNEEHWVIRYLGNCLTRQGEWEYEPTASSRSAAFLKRTRFNHIREAVAMWDKFKADTSQIPYHFRRRKPAL